MEAAQFFSRFCFFISQLTRCGKFHASIIKSRKPLPLHSDVWNILDSDNLPEEAKCS